MKTWHIEWEIEIEADTPKEAAQQALEMHRDPRSTATCFEVIDTTDYTSIHNIDLIDEPRPQQHIVVVGGSCSQLFFHGPFASFDDALEWAEHHCQGQWEVSALEVPDA